MGFRFVYGWYDKLTKLGSAACCLIWVKEVLNKLII